MCKYSTYTLQKFSIYTSHFKLSAYTLHVSVASPCSLALKLCVLLDLKKKKQFSNPFAADEIVIRYKFSCKIYRFHSSWQRVTNCHGLTIELQYDKEKSKIPTQ